MFGEADYGEQEFAASGTMNVFSKAFNEVVTVSDSLLKSIGKNLSETYSLTEIFIKTRIFIFIDSITMNDKIKKYVNGVNVIWRKSTKSIGSWIKETKLTDIWKRIRKQ